MKPCIEYIRVSTHKQAATSLGLDAQRYAIKSFCSRESYEVVASFQDIDSGGNDDRRGLTEAIELAKSKSIPIIVSKLCRLSREVFFIAKLMKHNVPFIVVELGQEVPPFMLHIIASLNQEQRRQVSINTKNALRQAKRNGVRLGTHNHKVLEGVKRRGTKTLERVGPDIIEAKMQGLTSRKQICDFLNNKKILSPTGRKWTKGTIYPILKKLSHSLGAK